MCCHRKGKAPAQTLAALNKVLNKGICGSGGGGGGTNTSIDDWDLKLLLYFTAMAGR